MKKPFIVLAGPTAVGKTELSLKLAKAIGGEIISADSMQVYKYMDIGSAKIMPSERDEIPHFLIDILEPTESFDVVMFQKLAKEAMERIYENGHIPILTGGTGFYIQAVLYDIDFAENKEDTDYRKKLALLASEKGTAFLHQLLQEVDPLAAEAIHANNRKRVIRALEFHKETGMQISAHNKKEQQKESPYDYHYFVLNDRRERLYANINKRVDLMMEKGLLEEVRYLKNSGCKKEAVSMQGLGYKELFSYLEDECTLEEAIADIKKNTRHFAKRQLTWFRRERDVIWIDKETFGYKDSEIIAHIVTNIRQENSEQVVDIERLGCQK